MAGKVPKTVTESEPISEIKKVTEPIGQKNIADEQINPATQESYSGQSTRDVAAPTDSEDYWLPEADSIDLSKVTTGATGAGALSMAVIRKA